MQVGDPFKEKLLLEACLELLARDAVAGIQDMGAAGLTCSTCETASRGGTGIEIDLAKVPKRESGMTPYEILLSESQERMLIIAKRGQENVVREVFEKWDVTCAEIGRVTDDGMMRVRNNGTCRRGNSSETIGGRSAALFARSKGASHKDHKGHKGILEEYSISLRLLRGRCVLCARLLAAIAARSIDRLEELGLSTVRSHGAHRHGCLAGIGRRGVFRVREANKILAATTDCNSLYCRARSSRRSAHRGGGGRAQSHLLRRETAGGDRQFEFRQSLQTGNFLATARSGRRRGGSVPRIRHAGHWRQRLFI